MIEAGVRRRLRLAQDARRGARRRPDPRAVAGHPRAPSSGKQLIRPRGRTPPASACVPLRPHPHPRRRVPGPAQASARGAARAVRRLGGARSTATATARRRVRGDPRLPPRAGVPATSPSSGRSTTTAASSAVRAAAGSPRPAGAPSRGATCRPPPTCSGARPTLLPDRRPSAGSALLPMLGEALMEIGEFAWAVLFLDEAVERPRSAGSRASTPTLVLTRLLVLHHVDRRPCSAGGATSSARSSGILPAPSARATTTCSPRAGACSGSSTARSAAGATRWPPSSRRSSTPASPARRASRRGSWPRTRWRPLRRPDAGPGGDRPLRGDRRQRPARPPGRGAGALLARLSARPCRATSPRPGELYGRAGHLLRDLGGAVLAAWTSLASRARGAPRRRPRERGARAGARLRGACRARGAVLPAAHRSPPRPGGAGAGPRRGGRRDRRDGTGARGRGRRRSPGALAPGAGQDAGREGRARRGRGAGAREPRAARADRRPRDEGGRPGRPGGGPARERDAPRARRPSTRRSTSTRRRATRSRPPASATCSAASSRRRPELAPRTAGPRRCRRPGARPGSPSCGTWRP